jgi:hypothetical protein
MSPETIEIRPIKVDEWLPDRCLKGMGPFDPACHLPQAGCPSLNYFREIGREGLVQLYTSVIEQYGCCGFVAWDGGKVIAYHNFFPLEVAKEVKFYGYDGAEPYLSEKTLVHNCLTIVRGGYLRKGISGRLVGGSVSWAKSNGWKRFDVHMVLPDCEKGWQSDQKSCLPFWERLGFEVFSEYPADSETQKFYGVTKRYSMCLHLNE